MTKEELRKAELLDLHIGGLRRQLADATAGTDSLPGHLSPEAILRVRAIVISDLEKQLAAAAAQFANFSVKPTTVPPPPLAA